MLHSSTEYVLHGSVTNLTRHDPRMDLDRQYTVG
jgi:hypothetical protein